MKEKRTEYFYVSWPAIEDVDAIIFTLLPHILKKSKITKRDAAGKIVSRISAVEASEAFVLHIEVRFLMDPGCYKPVTEID